MKSTPPSDLSRAFIDGIVEAIQLAYHETRPMFAPSKGLGSRWFGLTVAARIGPLLRDTVGWMPDVVVTETGASWETTNGRHRFRTNKLGRDESSDIDASFPRPSAAAGRMTRENQRQLTLGLADDDAVPAATRLLAPLPPPTRWVIGHMGSAEDGLRAVYICAPIEAEGGAIHRWREWFIAYRADGDYGKDEAPGMPDDGLPPPVDVPDYELGLGDEPAETESEADAG
jgi:hypothetical protein